LDSSDNVDPPETKTNLQRNKTKQKKLKTKEKKSMLVALNVFIGF
jgi:hypothetical protein